MTMLATHSVQRRSERTADSECLVKLIHPRTHLQSLCALTTQSQPQERNLRLSDAMATRMIGVGDGGGVPAMSLSARLKASAMPEEVSGRMGSAACAAAMIAL